MQGEWLAGGQSSLVPQTCMAAVMPPQVLADRDDCYCVLLHADVASSWQLVGPAAGPRAGSNSDGQPDDNNGAGGSSSEREAPAGESAEAAADALAGLSLNGSPKDAGASGSSSSSTDGTTAGPSRNSSSSLAEQQPQQQQQQPSAASRTSTRALGPSSQRQGGGGTCPSREVLVFSGFVGHSQLVAAMPPKVLGPLRRLFGEAGRTVVSRVLMRGPEGLGSADVVVTDLGSTPADGGHLGAAQAGSKVGVSRRGSSRGGPAPPLPKILQRTSLAARGLVDVARKVAQGGGGGDDSPADGSPRQAQHYPQQQLSCALMTLLVPVDMLATDILNALINTIGE